MHATIGKLWNKKQDRILDGCVEELQNRGKTAAIEDKIANLGLKQLKQAISDAVIRSVLDEKQEHKSLHAQPQP